MNKQPVLIILVCFISGIVLQDYFLLKLVPLLVFLGTVGGAAIISLIGKSIILIKLRPLFLGLLFLLLGGVLHYFNNVSPQLPQSAKNTTLVFSLDKKLNSNAKNKRYVVNVLRDNQPSFKSTMVIPKSQPELDYKHYYKGKVFINRPGSPLHSYQFNYAKYLARQHIFYRSYLPNELETTLKPDLSCHELYRQKRLDLLNVISASILSTATKNFLTSIILADRTEMDSDTVANFRRSGLIHLLTISGTHIAVVFGAIFYLFRWLLPVRYQWVKIPVSLVFIWFFAFFIGGGNPVIRACVMLTAYFIFIILQRKPDVLHAMSLAAFVLLILNTNNIFNVGFQLSFSAVFGIFWLNQPIVKLLPRTRSSFKKIFIYTFSVSTSAQLGTMPFVLYHFNQYAFAAIVSNLVIVPFAQLIIIFSLILTVFKALGVVLIPIDNIYDVMVINTLKVIEFFGSWEAAYFDAIPLNVIEFLILCCMIILLRSVIVKFSLKNILRFSFATLLFIAVNLGWNFYNYHKDEVMVHENFGDKVLSVKRKDHVYFYIKANQDKTKLIKYISKPYVTSVRASDYDFIELPEKIREVIINNKKYSLK